PSSAAVIQGIAGECAVEFTTRFPAIMDVHEYQTAKLQFENKEKVSALLAAFKVSGKIRSERFEFFGTHSVWTVRFASEDSYREWMKVTEEVESHWDDRRNAAGFVLSIKRV
ncbi:MAG TPA: hypothetical protein PL182_12750, partial [Pseudobdellovibrionaceae bacterium]|nr:hypothetical protein [Pseudobdellovibrionaceae bacterium]